MRTITSVVALSVLATAVAAQDVRLPAGDARVTGRVVAADTGAPLAGAEVTLQGINLPPGLAYRTITDAGGAFDFQNVYAPREYRVNASKSGFYTPRSLAVAPGEPVVVRERQAVAGVTVALNRGGAIVGRVVDAHGDPVEAIRVFAQRLQYTADGTRAVQAISAQSDVTDDLGQFRVFELVPGDYYVVAAGRSKGGGALAADPWSSTGSADTVPTFYPGTVDIGEAQVVSLTGGEESVQIVLRDQRPVSVSGTVRRADGTPATGLQLALSHTTNATVLGRGGALGRDGSFSIGGVTPGTYVVEAFTLPVPSAGGGTDTPAREHGAVTIRVGADDVRDVALVTSAGAEVRGTVVFERPFTGQSLDVTAAVTDLLRMGTTGLRSSARVGPDGRFTLSGVHERSRVFVASGEWMVKSVVVDGRDIGDAPLELGGRNRLTGVVITVTDRVSEVTIHAVDGNKRPLSNHTVVVLPIDNVPSAPRIAAYRTDKDGIVVVRRLRPASYVAGLVGVVEPGDIYAPDFEDRLRRNGHRFSIDEGETLRFDLPLTTGLLTP